MPEATQARSPRIRNRARSPRPILRTTSRRSRPATPADCGRVPATPHRSHPTPRRRPAPAPRAAHGSRARSHHEPAAADNPSSRSPASRFAGPRKNDSAANASASRASTIIARMLRDPGFAFVIASSMRGLRIQRPVAFHGFPLARATPARIGRHAREVSWLTAPSLCPPSRLPSGT